MADHEEITPTRALAPYAPFEDASAGMTAPSLSTSGETLTIEELLTLRARTENTGHGEEHEWSATGR
jgi:hypothetical protein